MTDFLNCLISHNGLAYLTGLVIFLITLFLAANKIIGFTLSLIFLLFALAASLGIANQKNIQDYVDQLSKTPPSKNVYKAPGTKPETSDINDQIQKAFDDLKGEFLIYKQKLDDLIKEYQSQKEENRSNNQ